LFCTTAAAGDGVERDLFLHTAGNIVTYSYCMKHLPANRERVFSHRFSFKRRHVGQCVIDLTERTAAEGVAFHSFCSRFIHCSPVHVYRLRQTRGRKCNMCIKYGSLKQMSKCARFLRPKTILT